MNQTRKEKARLRSVKHRAKRKTEVQELKREGEKLKNVLEYLRANAPDHWLAVQPIRHRKTTKPTNDLVEPKNLLWDEDLFADAMFNADCEDSKFTPPPRRAPLKKGLSAFIILQSRTRDIMRALPRIL